MQELKGCCLSSGDLVTLQRSGVALEVGGGVVKQTQRQKKVHLRSGRPTHQPSHVKHKEACG